MIGRAIALAVVAAFLPITLVLKSAPISYGGSYMERAHTGLIALVVGDRPVVMNVLLKEPRPGDAVVETQREVFMANTVFDGIKIHLSAVPKDNRGGVTIQNYEIVLEQKQ